MARPSCSHTHTSFIDIHQTNTNLNNNNPTSSIHYKTMAHEPSKMSGYTDKLTGGIKETTGKVLGNQEMRAEGLAKKEKGKAEVQAAKAEQQTIGTGEKMKGGLKEGVGNVLGNERMRTEGQADRIKGDIRKDTNI